ncbi:MAG: hypothetical protein V1850_00710, partial [Candidatus Bathyarchaeota archaeon]
GEIPYMKKGDFSKEDAIVNAFTRDRKARVTLSLKGPQDLTITRSKNRTNSTTSGKQILLLDADKSYQDAEALTYLGNTLSLDLEETSRSKFLHQETIRDALTYSPSERSAVIEKLLGTYDIKEFTKALDQKRRINAEIKDTEERMQALQRDQIRFIINLRQSLETLKEELLQNGYSEHHLDLAYSFYELTEIRKQLESAAQQIGEGIILPEVSNSIDSMINANNRIQEDLTAIDRKRMSEVTGRKTKINTIEMLAGSYKTALELLKEYETLDIATLSAEKAKIEIQQAEIKIGFDNIQNILTRLPSRIAAYETDIAILQRERESLEKALNTGGDETQLEKQVMTIKERLPLIAGELSKYSGQQRIVNLAAELIETTQAKNCPVCSQTINTQSLVSDLRSKVSGEISNKISALSSENAGIKNKITELEQLMVQLSRQRNTIVDQEIKVKTSLENLEKLTGKIDENTDLASLQKGYEAEAQELGTLSNELKDKFREYDEKIRGFNHVNQQISDNRKKLQQELGKTIEGLDLVEAAAQFVETLKLETMKLEKTSEIDIMGKRVAKLTEILVFLQDKERTENAEKELPALEEQRQTYEDRKTGLLLLSGSLGSISDIVTRYQKETSIQQIQNLEESMNETYRAILGHPYFSRIKIDVEKEEPLQFSFRAASDKEITYIPTKFSTAQLNVAALSIFLSNSKLMAGQLPLVTLDDPTQNMDSEHKEAFAGFISSLKQEFQVIIATEDDSTRDYLMEKSPDATIYEILSWDPEGPQIQ